MSFCQYCGARLGEIPATSPESPLSHKRPEARPAGPSREAPSPEVREAPGRELAGAAVPPRQAGSAPPPPRSQPPPPPLRAPEVGAARLIVVAQDGSPGRDYPLGAVQTDIGRTEGDIRLPNDPYVSPRHARIIRKEGRFFVRDLGSTNGVFVRLKSPSKLRHGDLVLVGLEVLRFEVVSDTEKGLGPATDGETQVFGSPMLPRYARLCQRTVEGVTRDVYYVSKDEIVIGREAGDVVFTTDPFMSRRHASISRERDGGFTLRDLGSSNGTYLAIREDMPLSDGDHVRVGQHLFRLDQGRGQG